MSVVIVRACYVANATILHARYVVVTATLRLVEFIIVMPSLQLFYVGDIHFTSMFCVFYYVFVTSTLRVVEFIIVMYSL